MVKNQFGGNKSKRMGRKFMNTGPQKTRFSEDPDEIYACCSKMHGPQCDVLCLDGKTRLCHIRNKFKGRGKRDSFISIGTWLLVGKRSFESENENKKGNCDLLEVYSENDKKKLIQHHPDNSWNILSSIQPVGSVNADDDDLDFEFGDSETMEYEELIKNATSEPTKHVCIEVEEDVDVDDI
jgi:hypothetical protein